MFSLVCALPSPASAEASAPLFGWFTGTTPQSDFSCTFMSAVRFMAFANRSCPFDQDVQEISRFSCMLFLSVRGFVDYALNDALLAARNNDRICFLNDQREFGASENTFHIRRTPETRTCSDTAKGVPLWVESPEVASHLPATDQVRHCLDQQSLAPHIYQTTICSP